MKKLVLAAAVFTAFAAQVVRAEEAKPAEPTPDNVMAYNAAVVSDYRFRGVSQSHQNPAVSAGADYTNNPTGLYLGTWVSSIKWTKDAGGSGNTEVDLYGGKRGEIVKDVSYDVGVLTYFYPSNHLRPTNANTTEIYGQIGYGPAYIKYSNALTNTFGFTNSKNSGYLDIGANIDVPNGFTVNLHAGHQTIKNTSIANYTDYKVGLTKDFGFVSGALAIIGTNAQNGVYATPAGKNNGKSTLVVSISKTF